MLSLPIGSSCQCHLADNPAAFRLCRSHLLLYARVSLASSPAREGPVHIALTLVAVNGGNPQSVRVASEDCLTRFAE